MKNVLIRQSVFRGSSRAYHDLELEVSKLTVGTDATSTIVLHGSGIEPQHAVISQNRSGEVQASSAGKHPILVNDQPVNQALLAEGDVLSVGEHALIVLPTPPGFDLALQVDMAASGPGQFEEASFRTDIRQLNLGKRRPAWVFAILVLLLFLLVPLLTTEFATRDGGAMLPGMLTDDAWSSGELLPAHALAIGDDCKRCHVEAFAHVPDSACTDCHRSVTHHAAQSLMAERGLQPGRCGSCHREHDESPMHRMIDNSGSDCAGCHGVTSLAGNHPEFTDYPNPERPQIIYDHAAHDTQYFPKTKRPFECGNCHRLDPAGQHQVIASFEAMCVDCHGEEGGDVPDKVFHHGHQVAAADPVVVFALPALDLRTLTPATGLGAWPEETKKGVRDGLSRLGLTPFVELLLSTDAEAGPALSRLKQAGLKLKSLRQAEKQQLHDVVTVIWGVKLLLDELDFYSADTVLRFHLTPIVGRTLRDRELAALSGQLQTGSVSSAVDLWFRGADASGIALLEDILQSGRSTVKHPAEYEEGGEDDIPGAPGVRTGRWSEEKFALMYQPSGHLDAFVKAWLDLSLGLMQTLPPAGEKDGFGPREAAQALFEELADSAAKPGKAKGAGNCTKCHSLVTDENGLRRVAWTSLTADPLQRVYTRYRHADHVGEDKQEICGDCHVRSEHSDILSSYLPEAEGQDYASNYEPLTRATCTRCHAPQGQASDRCLTCHYYHVSQPLQKAAASGKAAESGE